MTAQLIVCTDGELKGECAKRCPSGIYLKKKAALVDRFNRGFAKS